MAITLIDGTVLPDIPAEIEGYPYCIIYKTWGSMVEQQTGFAALYSFVASKAEIICIPPSITGGGNRLYSNTDGTAGYGSTGGEWSELSSETGVFDCPLNNVPEVGVEMAVVWANHDIFIATADNGDGTYTVGTEIHFANCAVPAYEYSDVYIADKDWIIGVADQARRLSETTDKLDDAGILAAFKAVPDPSGETVDELAKSIVERTITTLNNEDFTSIGSSGMRHCAKLTDVVLPNVTTLGQYAFYQCTALKRVELPLVTSIGNYGFGNCSVLEALILANTAKVCTLSNVNAFTGTLIAGGTGYIYVPSALLASYQAATNWSTYSAQFRAIEDYPDI